MSDRLQGHDHFVATLRRITSPNETKRLTIELAELRGTDCLTVGRLTHVVLLEPNPQA